MKRANRIQWKIFLTIIFIFIATGTCRTLMADKETNGAGNNQHIMDLSQEYDVPQATIEGMRDHKQGWGEIETELAIAKHLTETDPANYPEFTNALTRVESMRNEGKGYGQIAHELGFNLGSIESEAKKGSKEELSDSVKEVKENQRMQHDTAKELHQDAKENAQESRDAAKEAKDSAKASRDIVKELRKEAKEHGHSNRP